MNYLDLAKGLVGPNANSFQVQRAGVLALIHIGDALDHLNANGITLDIEPLAPSSEPSLDRT